MRKVMLVIVVVFCGFCVPEDGCFVGVGFFWCRVVLLELCIFEGLCVFWWGGFVFEIG